VVGHFWARVNVPPQAAGGLPYRAYWGMPDGPQQPMPVPSILVIEAQPDGFYLLIGYAADGAFAGDTWHEDVADAKGQATFAYGPYLAPWEPIPPEVQDTTAFALEQLRRG
jgi:hypothetical protein